MLVVGWPDWPPDEDRARRPGRSSRSWPWWEEFCPRVEVLRPGSVRDRRSRPGPVLRRGGALARKIIDAVRRAGFACQVGRGRRPVRGAELAARTVPPGRTGPAGLIVPPGETPAFLAGHPVSVLGSPDLATCCPGWASGRWASSRRCPPPRRRTGSGPRASLAHRLARGLDPRPLVPRPPAADLSVSVRVRPAVRAGRARGVRGQVAGRADARRAGRPRTGLRAGGGAGDLRGRAGDHPAVAARRAAVRARGRRAGALAARPAWRTPAQDGRRRSSARRDHAAAADPGPAGPRRGPSARPMGRRR